MTGTTFRPLTLDNWADFEDLFGQRGAYAGCWCMFWRLTRSQFTLQQGEQNHDAMKGIVESGEIPGILLYDGAVAVGWCSVAPREVFSSLNRSRILKAVDTAPVWSIVCFYVRKSHRRRGILPQLIQAADRFVRDQGGELLEAYPSIPRGDEVSPLTSFMGIPSTFAHEGFEPVSQPSRVKLIMRKMVSE